MFSIFSSAEDDTTATNPPTADQESSLLSGVASWLGIGGSSNAVVTEAKEDVDFETEDAEQDWVLVDKRDPNPAGSPQQDASLAGDEDAVPGDATAEAAEAESICIVDTATSTYQLEQEHGWVMTPRPCFTRSDQKRVEHNSYEDLLIEHPSMSIYEKLAMKETGVDEMRDRAWCWLYDHNGRPLMDEDYPPLPLVIIDIPANRNRGSRDDSLDGFPLVCVAPQQPDACQHRLETKLALMAKVKAVQASQRKQQQREKQGLNRKHLQRQNKTAVVQAQGKRAARNNRARNTSGAMKSRTPQRRH